MILTDTKHFSLEGTLKVPPSFPVRGEENHAVLSDVWVLEAESRGRIGNKGPDSAQGPSSPDTPCPNMH